MRTTGYSLLIALVLLPALLGLSCTGASGQSDLYTYVRKFQKTSLSQEALHRIKKYDELIAYFTGFSYIRPHHRVNPDFVKALILAESGADPQAVSNKKALGLGQIILSTGRLAGRELAKTGTTFRYVPKSTLIDIDRQDLFDPATNILLTCYLLAKYNAMFEGKLELVLSAWNAGEHTESLRYGQYAPYEETKTLIGRVNGYYLFLLRRHQALWEENLAY